MSIKFSESPPEGFRDAAASPAPTPITLDFEGLESDGAAPTFYDYRLTASAVHKATGRRAAALGYFAADGGAGESGASRGRVWRLRFAPPEPGLWRYTLQFRHAPNIAAQLEDALGGAVRALNSHQGELVASSALPASRAKAPEIGRAHV